MRIYKDRYEMLDLEQVRALQFQRLQGLMAFVRATNPFYRRLWDAAGVDLDRISSLEDFCERVPTVAKHDFVSDQESDPPFGSRHAYALSLSEPVEVYTTSGTSGYDVEIHMQTPRELREMQRLYGYLFRWAGLHPGDSVVLTLPLTMFGGGRLESQGANGYGLTVYPAGSYSADEKLDLIRRFRPRALYGSTTYLAHLAQVQDGLPSDGVDVLLTGLEGAGLSFLARLEQVWEAKVHDRFGCTQTRSDFMFSCEAGIGDETRPGLLHNLDPYVLTEVVDPASGRPVADGEFGEIVVTTLYHFDTPLIRCRLGDGGVWHEAAYCGCGRPFGGMEIGSITRVDDVKKVKGVNVFPAAVDDVVFAIPEVADYAVTLRSDETLSDVAALRLVRQRGSGRSDNELCDTLAHALRQRVGISFTVELTDSLPRNEGKARRWHDERIR